MSKSKNPSTRGINDIALWQGEYRRQLYSIRAALHSLRLQGEKQRQARPTSRATKNMAFWFDTVEQAFQLLNQTEPNTETDPLAPPGRREFLADLKGDDR